MSENKDSNFNEKALLYFKGDQLAADAFMNKYALRGETDEYLEFTPEDMHIRLASEFARIEQKYPNPLKKEEIFELFKDFKYIIPAGSPMSGIGNNYQTISLSNCFVIGNEDQDSYGSIMLMDEELVQISKRRGGVGHDISHYRPNGAPVKNSAKTSTGPVLFMERFSNSIREVGQCLHEDTIILTKRGLIKISSVNSGDYVWTEEGWVKVLNVIGNVKDTIKVTTKYGNEIICSDDHVFHTLNGERKIKDIKVGDVVSMISGDLDDDDIEYISLIEPIMENRGNRLRLLDLPEKLTEELSYILGYMYGDGSIFKKISKTTNNHIGTVISLSCDIKSRNIIDKLKVSIKNQFGVDVKELETSGNWINLDIRSQHLYEFLKINNILKEKSHDIVLPDIIKKSRKSVKMSFISGYFDADGYASDKKKGYVFTSVCKDFLLDIKYILQSYGILSKMHMEDRTDKGWRDIYNLAIVGASSKDIFYKTLNESCKLMGSSLSKGRDCFLSNYKSKDILVDSNYNDYSYVPDNSQFLSMNALKRLKEENVSLHNEAVLYQDLVTSKVDFQKDSKVYDLVLDRVHLFWANGYYVHNSGRRGALMLSMDVEHPNIEEFIDAKLDTKKVTGANISVKISDDFMRAVVNDSEFTHNFPIGSENPTVTKTIKARELWNKIVKNAHASAEPGILFWDNIIKESVPDCYGDVGYTSKSTNPCAELPLCPYDSCRLMSLNLYSYVDNPFTSESSFNFDKFKNHCMIAQKLMDDLVDLELEKIDKIIDKIKKDPEDDNTKAKELNLWLKIKDKTGKGRRTGLGVTAEGDMLAALGYKYGTREATDFSTLVHKMLATNAYKSSIIMAKDRGSFDVYNYHKEINNPFIQRILSSLEESGEKDILDLYKSFGRRNIGLLTVAPTGTLSLMTQTTSGIEPVFLPTYKRRRKVNPNDKNSRVDFIDDVGDSWEEYNVFHPKFITWLKVNGYDVDSTINMTGNDLEEIVKKSPYYGATSNDVDWREKVYMQGQIQKWVDHSISVTINLPSDVSEELVSELYMDAWEHGCKGVTIYRDGSRSGVLISDTKKKEEQAADMIKEYHIPRRPKYVECDIITFMNNKEKWIGFLGKIDGIPYEIFTGRYEAFPVPSGIKHGEIRKIKDNGHGARYDLIYHDKSGEKIIMEGLNRVFNTEFWNYAKLLSGILRQGMPAEFVLKTLDGLTWDGDHLNTWKAGVARIIKRYIKDGTKSSDKCPECGQETLIYREGCLSCLNCTYSKCQ